MPIIQNIDYKPSLLCRNGHVNTLYPYFSRKGPFPNYSRKQIETKDNDFLDLDYLKANNNKLIILCHGLEGSSQSQYIRGTASLFHEHHWDVLAMNYRGCGGSPNRQLRQYHSGATEDLHTIITPHLKDYEEIVLVGFSLGGNLVLKYAGDQVYPLDAKIKKVIAISSPIDLAAGAQEILKAKNYVYHREFMKCLMGKARIKQKLFPQDIKESDLNQVKNLIDFDDKFTGPIHGFRSAQDYYAQCNSIQFLQNIQIPALIINAEDDPFLPKECYPFQKAKESKFVHLMVPKYGGHVGFMTAGSKYYWDEHKILDFAENRAI